MRNTRSRFDQPGKPAPVRRIAGSAASRAGRRRHRDGGGLDLSHAQGRRHGARRLPHAQYARPVRRRGYCAHALPHRRLGVVRGGIAAVLREFSVRDRARPQRQSHQHGAAQERSVPPGPAARQHELRFGSAVERARPRTAGRCDQLQARSCDHLRCGIGRAPALPRCVCRRGHDRRLRSARVPRSFRHTPARVRPL